MCITLLQSILNPYFILMAGGRGDGAWPGGGGVVLAVCPC